MGEILGLGLSHGPFVLYNEDSFTGLVRRRIASEKTPVALRDPGNWPEPMQREWSDDQGLAAAGRHRAQLVAGFRRLRKLVDEFNPEVVLIWGDDQYENFHEDVVPAFCVYIEDAYQCQPFSRPSGSGGDKNVWDVGPDWTLHTKGHRQAAKELAVHLLEHKFDVAWAYQQLHGTFGHAFWRTVAHLDYDRAGFPYPVIPFHVNCYGRQFTRGKLEELAPPGPTPERCFEIGGEVARFFAQSPYRTLLIGSSSWSHGSLTAKHSFMYPDVEADRARYEELKAGAFASWKHILPEQLEDSGQHEMLNWICLAGAMDALGRKPTYTEFAESWTANSCKVFATFEP
jgi:hypothetical protein